MRNAVAENTIIKGEFRSRNVETLDDVRLQIAQALNEVRALYPEAKLDDHLDVQFETYTLTDDDPATNRVKKSLKTLGLNPVMRPSGGGTDGNVFRLNNISAVVIGMADHNMHTVREYVTIPDLVDSAHLCETIMRR